MNPFSLALLLFAFCSLLIGLFVLLKREDLTGKLFFFWNISIAGWAIPASIAFTNETTYKNALLATHFSHAASIIIPAIWLHFVLVFVGDYEKKKKWVKFFYLWSLILECFVFTPFFNPASRPIVGFNYYPVPGPAYHFFTLEFFVAVLYAFYKLLQALKVATGERKRSLNVFTWATFLAYLGGSLTFLPAYDIPFPQHGIFLMPIYPFMMAYAMIRHRLLDSEEILAIQKDKLALLGLMTSSLNHEIKNPLFLLRGYVQKAKSGEAQSIDKMTEQIDRIGKLTERLSEFSRAGSATAQKDEVDIAQAIDNALFFANHELKYHNIEIKKEIDPNLPKVLGDKGQFEQIFLNLIMNAFQAMKDGGALTITACSSTSRKPHAVARGGDASNQLVMVSIADTGHGIPKEQLKNIFKPFYTTKGKSGTGLGLHIVKTLVEQNGGKISVQSEERKGTAFLLSFLINS